MSKIIELGNYKGIEVEVVRQPITDLEVQNQLTQIKESTPSYQAKESDVVEMGDMTTIDFEGFKEGVAFEGGKGENYKLGIGSGQFIPGFEDGMVGMKKGETRDINVTFPENYGAKELAGQPVVFKVTVHEIETQVETVLDDAFVQRLQIPDIQTLDDLVEMIRKSLAQQKESVYRQEFENKVFDTLVASSKVEVNDDEIQHALDTQIHVMRNQIMQQGMQLEQYLEMTGSTLDQLKEQLKPNATKQAEFEAIVARIIELEGIETSKEEAENEAQAIADANKCTKEDVLKQVSLDMIIDNFNKLKATELVMKEAKNTYNA